MEGRAMMEVHSMFESISGEGGVFPQGAWCTFIRLIGCNLRCSWCDTLGAQDKMGDGAKNVSIENVVENCHTHNVLITGGEPLWRPNLTELLDALLGAGKNIQVETNGSLAVHSDLYHEVGWVIDRKCPSSKMTMQMLPPEDIPRTLNVRLKYVIKDKTDMEWAITDMLILDPMPGNEMNSMPFLVSPIDGSGNDLPFMINTLRTQAPELLDRIVFSVQLHKIFNMP